ncbi:MAG: TraR/DksA C4-type zinc finger protein [Bacteriovoracaceae bacterium]|nr:TraR/DksA C4-type zinc finger protein [Bacteriovoracaceae bacterium]
MDNQEAKVLINDTILRLNDEIKKLEETSKPISPDNAIGRLSRMEAIGEKSVNEAALRNAKLRVTKLNQALKRVNDDEYGECLECEEEISEKRLKTIPESTLCIKCASRIEA